jgi:regulator of cell morphogenesis and NO signaling
MEVGEGTTRARGAAALEPGASPDMAVDAETKVGDLARRWPASIRVFQRRGIDFCCGGNLPLREACARRGLDLDDLVLELRRGAQAGGGASEIDWNARPVVEIVGHILGRYHAGLRDELARLLAMARRAAERHGATHPELRAVRDLVERLTPEMGAHLDREERVIFPALLRGADGSSATKLSGELSDAEHEHARVGELLAGLRSATGGYETPAEACNTWRGLYHALAELERDTHLHVHLENNVLFPKVAARPACAWAPG